MTVLSIIRSSVVSMISKTSNKNASTKKDKKSSWGPLHLGEKYIFFNLIHYILQRTLLNLPTLVTMTITSLILTCIRPLISDTYGLQTYLYTYKADHSFLIPQVYDTPATRIHIQLRQSTQLWNRIRWSTSSLNESHTPHMWLYYSHSHSQLSY